MKIMLRGSSALILEWAYHNSPWIFSNDRLSDLFQSCLFHFFIAEKKKLGILSTDLNLTKNLMLGFDAFSKDCRSSLKVLKYGQTFRQAPDERRTQFLRALPEIQDFLQEFPFFFQSDAPSSAVGFH